MESRKMVLNNLFTGQQWRTDVENRLMDMGRGEKREHSYTVDWNVNIYSHYGSWYGDFLKN